MLNTAISSPAYEAMTDAQKAKVFEYVYDYAREKGRTAAIDGYAGMDEWMKGIRGDDVSEIFRRVTNSAMDDSISGSNAGELAQAYKVYQGMTAAQKKAFREASTGRVKYYLEAREDGITESDFVELYKKHGENADWQAAQGMVDAGLDATKAYDVMSLLAGITPQEGYRTVRPVQEYGAIAESKYTDAEKDLIMKAYMPDYDPTDKSPDKTELKYDTLRQKGYSPEEYAEIYAAYLDADKNAERIAAIQRLGYSPTEAQWLYTVFYGTYFKDK
jgi:hypothetical protein